MKKNTHIAALSIVATLFAITFATPVKADVVTFSNLNATTIDADSVSTYGPIAASFSSANYGTTLNQVSLKLSGAPDSGSLTVQLLSDLSTKPGTVLSTLGTLSDSALSSVLSNYTFTLAAPVGLAANTRYWIQLTSNATSANWAWSSDISGPEVAREYLSNSNGVFANASEAPYQMQILTAAPEPSGYGVLGLGMLGVLAVIRRKYSL